LYFLAENNGLRLVSASIASIIIATIPVFTPLFALPFLRERLSRKGIAGLVLSVSGVAVIVLEKQLVAEFTPAGLLLIFGAVLAAVGYSIAVKKIPTTYRPLTIAKVQSLLGLPFFVLMAVIVEGVPKVLPAPEVIWHLLYLGIFPSSLAFVFLSAGIRVVGANKAMVFTNLIPGITAVVAWLLLGETLTLQKVVGMGIVIAGVLLAQHRSPAADTPGIACSEPPPSGQR
ncbi:MAG: EamA family transporter, partial [Spirochaetales bacterium]